MIYKNKLKKKKLYASAMQFFRIVLSLSYCSCLKSQFI
jgi:hypothetical protein